MTSLQASRTLVKSSPELWAELSELSSLARHLGEFGEITITKVDPESRVEWEAERASGTVRLEPSGWGTRVVLTVDTPEAVVEIVEPEPAVEPEPEVVVEHEPTAAVRSEQMSTPEPTPVLEPEPEPEPEVEPEPVKRGFFARFFRRGRAAAPAKPVIEEAPEAAEQPLSEPLPAEPPAEPDPEPARSFGTIEWETPPPPPVAEEPEPEPLGEDEAHAVLTGVLDALGAAHHRPFSRP
jgi:hypothetical protein